MTSITKLFQDNCISYNIIMILAFVSVIRSLSDLMFKNQERKNAQESSMRNLLSALLMAYGYHLVWGYLCKTKQYKIAAGLLAIPFAYSLFFLMGFDNLFYEFDVVTNSPLSNNNLNNDIIRNLNIINENTIQEEQIPLIYSDGDVFIEPKRSSPSLLGYVESDASQPLDSMKNISSATPFARGGPAPVGIYGYGRENLQNRNQEINAYNSNGVVQNPYLMQQDALAMAASAQGLPV